MEVLRTGMYKNQRVKWYKGEYVIERNKIIYILKQGGKDE